MNLYDISTKYSELQTLLATEDGSDDALREAVQNAKTELGQDLQSGAEAMVKMIKNMGGIIASIDQEIDRLKRRKEANKAGIEKARHLLKATMIKMDTKKINTDIANLSLRKGMEKTVIHNEDALPADCFSEKIEIKPATSIIKEKIRSGEIDPGVATLERGEPLLTIK